MAVARLVAYLLGSASMGVIAHGAVGSSLHDVVWTPHEPTGPGEVRVVAEPSAAGGGPGLFPLAAPPPRAPNPPGPPPHLGADPPTAVPVGGATEESVVVLSGVASDPDAADALRLQVEVQPVGTDFRGDPIWTSDPVASGGRAMVRVANLANPTAYHWRARLLDQTGRASPWVSFGVNAESDADFQVAVAATQLAFTAQPSRVVAGGAVAPAVTGAAAISVLSSLALRCFRSASRAGAWASRSASR